MGAVQPSQEHEGSISNGCERSSPNSCESSSASGCSSSSTTGREGVGEASSELQKQESTKQRSAPQQAIQTCA